MWPYTWRSAFRTITVVVLLCLTFGMGPAKAQPSDTAKVFTTYFDPDWNFVVVGYACAPGIATPVWVKLSERGEGAAGDIDTALADDTGAENYRGEVVSHCRSGSAGQHFFRLKVAPDFVRGHPGMQVEARTKSGSVIEGSAILLPRNPVLGSIGSTSFQNDDTYVTGWACQKGGAAPLTVKIFRNAQPGNTDAAYVGSVVADLSVGDGDPVRICGRAKIGFRLLIPGDIRKEYPGQRLFAQAFASDPGTSPNYPLSGKSRIHPEALFFVSNQGGADATNAIRTAIADAIRASASRGAAEVVLSKGVYNLTSCMPPAPQHVACFELSNNNDGHLIVGGDEEGTELLMHQIEPGVFQARIGSNNLSLMDFSIDYATPGFTQGKIIAVKVSDERAPVGDRETLVDVAFDDDPQFPKMNTLCDLPLDRQTASFAAHNQWGYIADRVERGLKHDTPGFWFPRSCEKAAGADPHVWRMHMHRFFAQYAQPGDRYLQLVTRGNPVLLFLECHNVTLDNVTLHAGGGAATTWVKNTGAIKADHFQIAFKEPTRRLMTTTADGFIALGNWASIDIENSHFEGMGDDAINVHALGCFVGTVPTADNRSFEIVESHGLDCSPFYRVGDQVQIVSPITAQIKGTAKIASLIRHPGASKTTMTLDTSIAGLATGTLPSGGHASYTSDLVYNVSASSPGSKFINNVFGRFRGKAIVDKSPNSTISGNSFLNNSGPAMSFGQILGSTEGPLPWNIQVFDNVVRGGDDLGGLPPRGSDQIDLVAENFTGNPLGGPYGITFRHNQFLNPTGRVFNVRGASDISIIDSYIEASAATPRAIPGFEIELTAARKITISGLYVQDRRPSTLGPLTTGSGNPRATDLVVNALQ